MRQMVWGQKEGLRTYHCPNCGAEIMTDENTAATFCSFCGSPTLIEERLSGVLRPKYLIPFQIDREKAKEMFRKWTRRGSLYAAGIFLFQRAG